MQEKRMGSKKAGTYVLITLGIVSIIVSTLIILGSIFVQLQITSGVNKIYDQVEKTYQTTDDIVVKAQRFVDNVKTDFNKVFSIINVLTVSDRKKVTDAIDSINAKVIDAQKFLDDAKNSVIQTNEKIDIVNSLGVVTLPELSGERVQSVSEKVNGLSSDLNNLKTDISNGNTKQSAVDRVNSGVDNTQELLSGYRVKISEAKQDAKDFKDLIIFWSTLGTIFIVGFFCWSIYSFYYFTKSQIKKLKVLNRRG